MHSIARTALLQQDKECFLAIMKSSLLVEERFFGFEFLHYTIKISNLSDPESNPKSLKCEPCYHRVTKCVVSDTWPSLSTSAEMLMSDALSKHSPTAAACLFLAAGLLEVNSPCSVISCSTYYSRFSRKNK